MASINWKKMTAKDLDGISVHFDKEMRIRHKHSNENIDSDKTYLNYDMEKPYKESIYELKDKVKEIDKKIPPKRKFGYDKRVIAIALETPCPDEIAKLYPRAEDDFFKTIYKCEKLYFKDKVMFGSVHKDEKHTYINPITKKIENSKAHLHTLIIPYDEKYGVNGRNFVTKELMIRFNKYCDSAVFNQFGLHLNNGQGRNNWGNVESLKRDSKKFELNIGDKDKHIENLERERSNIEFSRDELFDVTYSVMHNFRKSSPKAYKEYVGKEYKYNETINTIARMLSEEQFGVGNRGKDPMWAELEREEEERKKKRKKEEMERYREI